MPSNKQLRPHQIEEIMKIPKSWIKMFGIDGLVKRFKTTKYLLEKEARNNKLLAKQIEYEWSPSNKSLGRNKEK